MSTEHQPQQGDNTAKPSPMPDKYVAEGAVISDKTTQTIFNKANAGIPSTEQTNKLCGSVEITDQRSSIQDSLSSDRKKPAESGEAYKKSDYRIVYDSPGGTRNMDRYHYEEVKDESLPSEKMKEELLKPIDLSTMDNKIPTNLLKPNISIDKQQVNITGNNQADKFTTNKPVEKNSSEKQKPIPTDIRSSIESIDRSTKPLRDVANLYHTLDKDRNGLSMAEINSGIQDDHYTDGNGKDLYDDRAVGLAVLHNQYKEFKGLSADGEQVITPQDIDKFKKIPTLIAMERVAGDAEIVRFLDGNNGRSVNDGKINKTELSGVIGDLQDGPTKEAVQAMLADFTIITKGSDYIDTASIKTQVADYAHMKLTPQETNLAHGAESTAETSRKRLDQITGKDIFKGDQTNTFQVLQSQIGDCYALSSLSSTMYRTPGAIKRIFGQDDAGNLSMRTSLKDNGQNLPTTISVSPPTRAELAIYAGSRGDSLSVNATEKLMGEFARKFPEQWSKIIGTTADAIIDPKDNPSPHEYLEGGGMPDGVLTLLTGDEYKTYSLESFRDNNKLEEGLKRLKSDSPAVLIVEANWLNSGISSPTSNGLRSAGGIGDGDRKNEKTSKEKPEALPKKDGLSIENDLTNSGHFGLDRTGSTKRKEDREGNGKVDWETTQRTQRSRNQDYHGIAVLEHNPATQELLLYNSWGSGEGSSSPKDGLNDGKFSQKLSELKKLNGAIVLPSYIFKD